MFLQYPQDDVNAPILLHRGRFRVRAGDRRIEASGSAHLRWLPRPGIEFDVDTDAPWCGNDLGSLAVELPGFRTKKPVALSTNWGSTPSGSTRIRAFAGEMEWGGEESLLSAGFQIVNFPDVITPGPAAVPGDPTTMGSGYGTIQTVGLEHDGWKIRFVAVRESGDRYRKLKATGGYAVTHVGQLTRTDGSVFAVDKGREILELLQQFLSLARGAACSLPIQWGRGSNGEITWRRFGSQAVDGWRRSYLSWIGEGLHTGGILAELFDPFCAIHKDTKLRKPFGVALHWYRHCNTNSSGLEGSLILGMAALEALGALVVVAVDGSMSAEEYDGIQGGAKRLRKLLSALNVPTTIPLRYQALTTFARNRDACHALVELRNGFVHANERRRRIVFGPEGKAATPDASQLALWYQELALLRVLQHRGHYFNRTTAEWTGQIEPVPWSKLEASPPDS